MLPGPTILSTRRNGRGPVGQRRDRLGAADAVALGRRRPRGGREDGGLRRARRAGGRSEHDLAHPGHPGRNRRHEHGRRIGRAAAGHVDADALERPHFLAQHGPVLVGDPPGPVGQRPPRDSARCDRRRTGAKPPAPPVARAPSASAKSCSAGWRDPARGPRAGEKRSKRAVSSTSASSPRACTSATMSSTAAVMPGSTREGGPLQPRPQRHPCPRARASSVWRGTSCPVIVGASSKPGA